MPAPTISALPDPPSRNAPDTFSARADAFLAAFPTLRTDINALVDYLNGGVTANTVLGTVSQSGGIPTGSIIERGSNANGSYVRFADGTQICTADIPVDVTTTASQTFSFPASFAGGRGGISVSFGHQTGNPNSALEWGNIIASGNALTSWAIKLATAGTSTDPSSIEERLSASAFGRWF